MAKNPLRRMLTEQATGICLVSNIPKLYAKDAMIRPLFFYESDPVGKVLDKLKREDQKCVHCSRQREEIPWGDRRP